MGYHPSNAMLEKMADIMFIDVIKLLYPKTPDLCVNDSNAP